MNPTNLLWACLLAALITLPPLFGFIALMYYFDVHPALTSFATAVLAILIGQFLAVPVIRKIINRK